jgi:hypothetical protein
LFCSNFRNPYVKQALFGEKNSHTVKKLEMYLFITQERVEISQKFQWIWIQQANGNFSE